jgi:hypothetical protein
MILKTMAARTLFAAAALSALATSANAFVLGIDPQIFINRTIDSPTLTVRYTGATPALVELRINGASFGTRTVSGSKDNGETNFTVSPGDLQSGDNDVEIRLFDRTGKLIAKDHANISVAVAQSGPVYLSSPKTGDTVRGSVEINMGFDHDLKDPYVSFFIDGSFKKMTNVPPFVYTWDTERESNGWHELEAWAIDDSSETHKTSKIKVFVNNPSGQTRRFGVKTNELVPSGNGSTDLIASKDKGIKKVGGKTKFVRTPFNPLPPTAPSIDPESVLGTAATVKTIKTGSESIAMGVRTMAPTGTRVVKPAPRIVASYSTPRVSQPANRESVREVVSITIHRDPKVVIHNMTSTERVAVNSSPVHPVNVLSNVALSHQAGNMISNVTAATSLVKISKGSRLPNFGAFEIALDSEVVDFHGVLPRVDAGVPMTPLRFLVEKKGGAVDWDNLSKTVFAKADGNDFSVKIGSIFALVNRGNVKMERASYLDGSRTVVPLSFMETALHVKIDYDKNSNHMLITSKP